MVQVVLYREAVDEPLEDERLRIEGLPDGMHTRVLLPAQSRRDGLVVVAQLDEAVGYTARIEVRHPRALTLMLMSGQAAKAARRGQKACVTLVRLLFSALLYSCSIVAPCCMQAMEQSKWMSAQDRQLKPA